MWLRSCPKRFWLWNSPQRIFEYFSETARGIALFLGALSVPILGMVFYYIILTASLTVSRRRNEVAMLRSRGASAFQVVLSFLVEWLMLGGVAFVIGPFIGLFIARVMGASAGFLSFVDRRALPVSIVPDAYRYGAIAVAVSVLACLIPVIGASRFSIVTFKQEVVRSQRKPLWERFLLDFILLGTSFYGYRTLTQQRLIMTLQTQSSREALALLMDPMLFFVPVIFLLGAGLFVLRIFPLHHALPVMDHGTFPGRILDTDDQTTRPQRQAIYSLAPVANRDSCPRYLLSGSGSHPVSQF